MPETGQIVGYAAVAYVAVKETFNLIRWLVERANKPETPHVTIAGQDTNGKSGDKPPSYWILEFSKSTYECSVRAIRELLPPLLKEALREHDEKVRRPDWDEAADSRRAIMMELQQLKRDLASAIAEINRQLRDR